ncbi:MAG: hypothetical protein EA353_01105 [Puniceicoccaceae bacterium]|nr:MAG: hypothetical protein EA353_01105 [Puniceicoccaceae bacterium]
MNDLHTLQLKDGLCLSGHPWARLSNLVAPLPSGPGVAMLLDSRGTPLGSGIFDGRDPQAAWRRFSMAEEARFDEAYVAAAINDALGRRGDEHCQRLICADADYLPGLEVDLYEGILAITSTHPVVDAVMEAIVSCLQEACEPKEMVFLHDDPRRAALRLECGRRTLSGQNLKARWIEVDGIAYRLDLLNADKPRIYLDQREQHALVGSLCEGRTVLDGYAHSGAFALQAVRSGAEHVVAVDTAEACVKAIGAQAQKNDGFIETIQADVAAFLGERQPGELDAIILDPPELARIDAAAVEALHLSAFQCLPEGGLLASYCRSPETPLADFEACVARAAARAGREARVFARTAQPFDFPVRLNFPQSHYLKGLILQLE